MNSLTQTEAAVRQTIDDLIQTATSFDIDALEKIYHDDLQVVMIDTEDTIDVADKAAFKGLFASKFAAGDPPMSTWARYHHVQVDGERAHVLLARKNDLNGTDMHLTLSIDLVHEDARWQVMREVIFLRPDD